MLANRMSNDPTLNSVITHEVVTVAHPPPGETMCGICVVSSPKPEVDFQLVDGKRICAECAAELKNPLDRKALHQMWLELMERERGGDDYDFILAFSGGADSTAALKLLVKEYKLRVLAFTVDNGMKSPQIWKNVVDTVRHLGVDWHYIHDATAPGTIVGALKEGDKICGDLCWKAWKQPNFDRMMRIFRKNCVLTGMEMPIENGIMHPTLKVVAFMAAHLWSKGEIFKYISDLPWQAPEWVQGFDTDCLGGGFGLELYRAKHRRHAPAVIGFISERVRLGLLDRDEELAKLNVPVREAEWEFLESRVGPVRERAAAHFMDVAGRGAAAAMGGGEQLVHLRTPSKSSRPS